MFAVIMNRDSPLPIMIFDQQRTICAGPGAPLSSHSWKGNPLKPGFDLSGNVSNAALRCYRGSLNRFGGGTDDIDHRVGVGEHGNVAAGDLSHFGAHALRKEPFQIGVDGAVVLADDVPARLRLPGSSPGFRVEQVGFGDALSRPNELLLLL